MARSFLRTNDLTIKDLSEIFDRIKLRKSEIKKHKKIDSLDNKVIGLLFEKPSTRTRVSFESAVLRLGGKPIYIASSDTQIKRGEPIKDTARILGGYLDGLVARVFAQDTVDGLAEFSGIPVLNGLSDFEHPTQIVCDLFTVLEVKGSLKGLTLTYIGDGNNVCNSLAIGCALCGMNFVAACPKGYYPDENVMKIAKDIAAKTSSKLSIVENPKDAAKGADVLYTDTWVSMGEESKKQEKLKTFQGYQINSELLKLANKDAVVMHCLPAYRELEITDEMMEGPRSVIWQQGENKMHGAAGILDYFMGK